MSDLKKALEFLLYDNIETNELDELDSDNDFIDLIIDMSIEQHSARCTCPYKNYDAVDLCSNNQSATCDDGKLSSISCNDEIEIVFKRWYEEIILGHK